MRKQCPKAEPMLCKNCGQEGKLIISFPLLYTVLTSHTSGHTRAKCENPRKIDRSTITEVEAEKAWSDLVQAVKEKDIDEVKECIQRYLKAFPNTTMAEFQIAMYNQNLGLYLIATERQLLSTYTNMDYQGNLKKKYSVSYRFTPKPERPREADGWPMDKDEILKRLDDAGEVVDIGLPLCMNCNEIGHISKNCPEEKQENVDRPAIKCFNCGEVGHRVRDCPTPRQDKFACRNCGQSGHNSRECPEPRSADNVECRKCGESKFLVAFLATCNISDSLSSGSLFARLPYWWRGRRCLPQLWSRGPQVSRVPRASQA